MATKSRRKLPDSEILSLVNDGVKAGVKFNDSKLSRERKRVSDYYNGLLPAPVHGGNSRYVSTDVFDSIESMKSTLLETFSAHADIVQFGPKNEDDVQESLQASAYTKHVVFEQNAGIELFDTILHDGLSARNAVAKVFWEDKTEKIDESFEGLSPDEFALLLDEDGVTLVEVDIDDDDLFSGIITKDDRKAQVRIVPVPPEEFIVCPNIKSLALAPQLSHRTESSKSDLLKDGYDKAKVALLKCGDNELAMDDERINRFATVSDSFSTEERREDAAKLHTVYETYAWLDLDRAGTTRLWKIVHSGEVILEREAVERHPFITFCPLPIPHSYYGGNFAAKVIPTQNAKTVLTRSILDHAVLANNPRYGVVKGALTNPRELLDNRIGGLVNVTRQDGIFPLPQAPLNPFVFQTIEMLDSDKEDVTGVSRLSQGLNKDAISSQNSQGMVEQLIGASMQRQKTIARFFGLFLKAIYMEVYRLVLENEDRDRIVEIAGEFTEVKPRDWARSRDVTVDLRLGYGEKEKLAQEYLEFGQILAADAAVAPLFGMEERRNLYKLVMEAKGHKNVSQILKPLDKAEPQEPDPVMVAELEKLKAETAAIASREARADAEVKQTLELNQLKADMEQRFKTMEIMFKDRDADRKDAETDNRIEVAAVEMDLAIKAQAEAPEQNQKASAIISPNG